MTQAEDLVRSTTRALAGTVQAVRPLPALSQTPQLDEVSRGRGQRRAAPERHHAKRTRSWLFPLAAAASVVVIVLASLIAAHHLASPARTRGAPATPARAPRPEFYMTATYPASGPNVLLFQVRSTAGGAVTGSTSLPAANMGWAGLTAAASDRAFYLARYPCSSTKDAVSTFYRITVTGSGRISGIAAVGRVPGKVTDLALSADGSRMAYNALPGKCPDPTVLESPAMGSVSILDLSTGAVRTWQNTNTTGRNTVGGLSWAPDGRTLIIDEHSRVAGGEPGLTVFGLNTASSGGSLQAHSTTLLQQNRDCSIPTTSTCVTAVLAGPHDSLTVLASRLAGQQIRVLVVRIPLPAGRHQTVLYSQLSPTTISGTGLFADSSGQWLLLWPTNGMPARLQQAAGWISGGRLHPLPGVAQVFPQGVAW